MRRAHAAPTAPAERTARPLYAEIVFASFLSAAAAFNTTYVLRLGGSNALVGLLTSLPALVAVVVYLPAARILERTTRQMGWVVGSLSLARPGYLVVALLPLALRTHLPEATVAVLVAVQVPAVFFFRPPGAPYCRT